MSDCAISYSAVSHPRRRWTWTIPTIVVVGTIVGGLWAGHHQPEPISCEPGSHVSIRQNVVSSTIPDIETCWQSPR
jgi:hypothetical protein